MKISKQLSTKLSRPAAKNLAIAFCVVSFIGFLDATFLAVKFFLHEPVRCSLLEGCATVTSSAYAHLGPVPVALLGTIYYLAMFILSVHYLDTHDARRFLLTTKLAILGFCASLWFVALQIFIIQAICIYCMLSAISSTTLFILGFLIREKIDPLSKVSFFPRASDFRRHDSA